MADAVVTIIKDTEFMSIVDISPTLYGISNMATMLNETHGYDTSILYIFQVENKNKSDWIRLVIIYK